MVHQGPAGPRPAGRVWSATASVARCSEVLRALGPLSPARAAPFIAAGERAAFVPVLAGLSSPDLPTVAFSQRLPSLEDSVAMSDRPTPRPKNARVQSPPSCVDASTPESIVRLLSDLKLHSGPPLSGPTPDTSSSSSLASQPASTKASSGRTASASALNVVRGTALRDPFDVDGPTAAGASASSSGVPASRLSVRTVSSSRQWGSVKDVDSQSVSELSVAWTDDLASSTIEKCYHRLGATLEPVPPSRRPLTGNRLIGQLHDRHNLLHVRP